MNRAYNRSAEYEELSVACGVSPIDQVTGFSRTHRPVYVFTATIQASEWFFVHQALEAVLLSNRFEGEHQQLLVVSCNVGRFENRSDFELTWSYFVVTSFNCTPSL